MSKNKCKTCFYGKKFVNGIIYCDYLLMTASRRPCPADNCTVYKRKEERKTKLTY